MFNYAPPTSKLVQRFQELEQLGGSNEMRLGQAHAYAYVRASPRPESSTIKLSASGAITLHEPGRACGEALASVTEAAVCGSSTSKENVKACVASRHRFQAQCLNLEGDP